MLEEYRVTLRANGVTETITVDAVGPEIAGDLAQAIFGGEVVEAVKVSCS